MRVPVLVVLAACSGKAAEPTPAPVDPWKGSANVPPPVPAPKLIVQTTGAEPRARISYALPAYQRSFVYDDRTIMNGTPSTSVELTVVWACKAGGACSYELAKFFMPGAPPDEAIESIAKSTRGEVTFQPDGSALVQPTTFMRTMPSIVELLKLSVVQVPAEPIGIGAIWRIDDAEAKRTFTLTKAAAPAFTVSADLVYPDGMTTHAVLSFDRGEPLAQTLELAQKVTQDLGGGPPITVETTLAIRPPRE